MVPRGKKMIFFFTILHHTALHKMAETQLVQMDLQLERELLKGLLSYVARHKGQFGIVYIELGLLENNDTRRIVTKAITSYGHRVNNLEYLLLRELLTAVTSYDASTMDAVTFIPWYKPHCKIKDVCLRLLRRYINPSSYIFKMTLTKKCMEQNMHSQMHMHTYFEFFDDDIKMFPIYQIVEVNQSLPYGSSLNNCSRKAYWRSFESGKIM